MGKQLIDLNSIAATTTERSPATPTIGAREVPTNLPYKPFQPLNYPLSLPVGGFKARVSRWANSHHPTYRTMLYVIARHTDYAGTMTLPGTWTMTIDTIRTEMRAAFKKQGRRDPWVPEYSTIKRYFHDLRAAGILITEQTWFYRDGRRQPGGLRFRPQFHLVLNDEREVEPHDFMALIDPPARPAVAGTASENQWIQPSPPKSARDGSFTTSPNTSIVREPATEPPNEPIIEPSTEPQVSHLSSTYKKSEVVPEVQEHACTGAGAQEEDNDDGEPEPRTWAEIFDIPDLNNDRVDCMIEQLNFGHVSGAYVIRLFLDRRGDSMSAARNPGGFLISVLPSWWAENQPWISAQFDEDYPDEERLAADAAARESDAAAEQARALAEREQRRLIEQENQRLADEARRLEEAVSRLHRRFNEGYGDIYDFLGLLEDGYSPDAILEDLRNREAEAYELPPEAGINPHAWRENSGGEDGLRARLGERTSRRVEPGSLGA